MIKLKDLILGNTLVSYEHLKKIQLYEARFYFHFISCFYPDLFLFLFSQVSPHCVQYKFTKASLIYMYCPYGIILAFLFTNKGQVSLKYRECIEKE